jgi:hypothetical protein
MEATVTPPRRRCTSHVHVSLSPIPRQRVTHPSWAKQASHPDKEADAQIRTGDPFITSEVLYQLSYVGEAFTVAASSVCVLAPEGVRQAFALSSGRECLPQSLRASMNFSTYSASGWVSLTT